MPYSESEWFLSLSLSLSTRLSPPACLSADALPYPWTGEQGSCGNTQCNLYQLGVSSSLEINCAFSTTRFDAIKNHHVQIVE